MTTLPPDLSVIRVAALMLAVAALLSAWQSQRLQRTMGAPAALPAAKVQAQNQWVRIRRRLLRLAVAASCLLIGALLTLWKVAHG